MPEYFTLGSSFNDSYIDHILNLQTTPYILALLLTDLGSVINLSMC